MNDTTEKPVYVKYLCPACHTEGNSKVENGKQGFAACSNCGKIVETINPGQCVYPDLVKQALDKIRTIADCVKTAGEIPSGTLYALSLNVLSLDEYERIIATLKNAGIISESNYLLKWELEAAQ